MASDPAAQKRARVRAAAEAGDAEAQYLLAAELSAEGDGQNADAWLRRAAEAGLGDAIYTLATRDCGSTEGIAGVIPDLRRAAEAGSLPASRLLGVCAARGWGLAPDARSALESALRAGEGGEPASMAGLAIALDISDPANANIVPMLRAAAQKGSAAAAAARVRRFASGADDDADEISRFLMMLERARYPNATSLRAAIEARRKSQEGAQDVDATGEDATREDATREIDWRDVRLALAQEATERQYTEEALSTTPDAKVYRTAFSAAACEYVMASAVRLLQPSRIVDPTTGAARADPYRSSLTAVVSPVDYDAGLNFIAERIAVLAAEPLGNAEFLSVLRYAPGQEYRPHFDWLPEGEDLQRGGQRRTTALLYLNDEYEGGETAFTEAGAGFRGGPGDLLVFRNTGPEGAPDMTSRHASLPVKSGAKWIASQWFRMNAYRF